MKSTRRRQPRSKGPGTVSLRHIIGRYGAKRSKDFPFLYEVRATRLQSLGHLFQCLSDIQRLAESEGGSFSRRRWVFRGHQDARFELLPKSRRSGNTPKASNALQALRDAIATALDEAGELHRIPDGPRAPSRSLRWPPNPNCRDVVCEPDRGAKEKLAQSLRTLYHRIQCQLECQLVREFSVRADEIGLPLLDSIDAPLDRRSTLFDTPPVWIPSRTTSLAQHHDIPTKLLDWSRRYTVALHFAAQPLDAGSRDMAIWALDGALFGVGAHFDSRVRTMTSPHSEHNFLHAQDGLFTWCDEVFSAEFFAKHCRWPSLCEAIDGEGLGKESLAMFKVSVPRTWARALRDELRHMGVSIASMMPTYNNVALSLFNEWDDRLKLHSHRRSGL